MENMDLKVRKMEKYWEKEEMYEECFKKAAKKIIGEYCYDLIMKDPKKLGKYLIKERTNEMVNYCMKRKKSRYSFIMFTINPKENTKVNDFCVKICKCLKKVWIGQWTFCIEWRNQNEGMHCHMLVEILDGKNVYYCKREVYNTFKNMVGTKRHINVRYTNDARAFHAYINGLKKGKKKKNYDWDIKMRKRYKINDVYRSATLRL